MGTFIWGMITGTIANALFLTVFVALLGWENPHWREFAFLAAMMYVVAFLKASED